MKALLRRVGVSQPLNYVTTSATRVALSALRLESDFVVKNLHRAGSVRCKLPNGRSLVLWSPGDGWVRYCQELWIE